MKPMTCSEAEAMFADRPFSFIETCGTRCTVLTLCYSKVVTAANCVEFDPCQPFPRFLVSTAAYV